MYYPGATQSNSTFANMSRTFYPKHVSYFGNGSGRDSGIIMNNGGLNAIDKIGMGNHGIHFKAHNSNARKKSPSPGKIPATHYY
jgi:hypothetical protein